MPSSSHLSSARVALTHHDSNDPQTVRRSASRQKRRGPVSVPVSKAIARRLSAVNELVATLDSNQKETVAGALEERLATVLGAGESMPDLRHLFDLLQRLAKKSGEDLRAAEHGRSTEAFRRNRAYHERDRAAERLRGEVSRLRKALVELYGAAACRDRFGWGKRTARRPYEIHTEANAILLHLRSEDPMPQPRVPGFRVAPEEWIAALEPLVEELDRAMIEAESQRMEAVSHAGSRLRALEECDETYLAVMQTCEALYRVAGEMEMRRRLRPKGKPRKRPPAPGSTAKKSPRDGEKEAHTKGLPGLATLLPWRRQPSGKAVSLPDSRWSKSIAAGWQGSRSALLRLAMGVASAGIA